MTGYCRDHFQADFGRSKVADSEDVGTYRNGDGHLYLASCEIGGDAFSDASAATAFYYDRRLRRAFTEDGWHRATPCREWDPDRSSTYCETHPKS